MKNPHLANIVNAAFLILLGLVAYLMAEEKSSVTALIPTAFGAILLAMTPGIKKHHKVIAHVAVTLTLLGAVGGLSMFFIGLGKPEPATDLAAGQHLNKLVSQGAMGVSCLVALGFFISNFVYIRKQRKLDAEGAKVENDET